MGTLEFRHPQFSEDLPWLPCWLQQNQTVLPKELNLPIKEGFGVIHKLEDTHLYPNNDGCSSYHLFLSGEDSLPLSPEIKKQAVHFELHLSSFGTSECSQSEDLYESQHPFEPNKVHSVCMVETSLDSKEHTPSKRGINDGQRDSVPQAINMDNAVNVVCQSLMNTEDQESHLGKKSDVSYLKDDEVKNAIELSVVASEALVIHDLLKTEVESVALPVEAVLEVSLQVKKSRIELVENVFQSLNEEADLSDSFSDLDDLMMNDAFDDVGLSCSTLNIDQIIHDTASIEVHNAPVIENRTTNDIECNSVNMKIQREKLEDKSMQKQLEEDYDKTGLEGLPMEPMGYSIQNNHFNDIVSPSGPPNVSKHDNSTFHQSAQKTPDEFVGKQKVAFSTVNTSLYMPHTCANFTLQDCMPASMEEHEDFVTPDKFKSRWLGGWTGKEVDVSGKLRQNGGQTIPKLFARETSFLSESADVVSDKNSCVQRCEIKSQIASQSSVGFDCLDDEGLIVSEDAVKCSLSLVDPLCSFVPCSISLDTDCSRQNPNERKDYANKCFSTAPEIEMENVDVSKCKIKSQHKPRCVSPPNTAGSFVNIGDSRSTIQRQSTLLKTYSVILPTHVASFEGRRLDNNRSHNLQSNMRLLSSDHHLEPLPLGNTEDYQTNAGQNLVVEITELKNRSVEVADDRSEFPDQSMNKRTTHGTLKQSMQVSKPIIKKSSIKKRDLPSSELETLSDPQMIKSVMKMQYDSKNTLDPHLSVLKRVRFSETNVQAQSGDIQKLHPAPKYCPSPRVVKIRKSSNQCLASRDHDRSCYLISRQCRAGKRLIFQGIRFLLTGFSSKKEKHMEELVWNHGGVILPDIPCPSSRGKKISKENCGPPMIISSKKLQTTRFLYGCAVNALIVNVNWLTDSIAAGSMLPHWKYAIISNHANNTGIGRPIRQGSRRYIFEKVGIMLQGRQIFCTKFAKVLRHGGGQVFKTLQWLIKSLSKQNISIGVIVFEDEHKASRHLKQCALEHTIPMTSAKWIVKSLHMGELLRFTDKSAA